MSKNAELNSAKECQKCCSQRNREYYNKNRQQKIEKTKQYYHKNREKILNYAEQYRIKNKTKINNRQANYRKKRYACDPLFKLMSTCRSRISQALKRQSYKKTKSSYDLLGCSWLELRIYLENQFTVGMSWENYGEWHVDHIVPLCSASNEQEILALFHYTNLQPLWAVDNLKKRRW